MTKGTFAGDVESERPEYPFRLREAEVECVRLRRRRVPSETSPEGDPHELPPDAFGVALSGGGIRSATFCLGVFRALARARLVRKIDFLSTVSGGGYFGAFLGGLYARPSCPACGPGRATDAAPSPGGSPSGTCTRARALCVEDALQDLRSEPVTWLRENGRYLSPNGAGDTFMAGAVLLRNWAALIVVISAFVVTGFATAALLVQAAWSWREAPGPWAAAVLPAVLVTAAVLPLALAYWLTPLTDPEGRIRMLGAVSLAGLLAVWSPGGGWQARVITAVVLSLAVGAWLAAWFLAERRQAMLTKGVRTPVPVLMRNQLSRWLSLAVWSAVGLAVFALADAAGRLVAATPSVIAGWIAAAAAVLSGAFGAARRLLPMLGPIGGGTRLPLTPRMLVGATALVVGSLFVVALSALAHWLGGRAGAVTVWAGGAMLTAAFGLALPFLNLSSHSTLYAQRLTRAYLGASNEDRHGRRSTISETLPRDGIALDDYAPHDRGGPLHLINVTVNETVSGTSQLEQRDRKGRPMAVGPCGVSVGRQDHALWPKGLERGAALAAVPCACRKGEVRVFPGQSSGERLGLGEWISISGAAFTTGVGSRTSLAISFLLSLANVRLGHWWNSGIEPATRRSGTGMPRAGAALGRWYAAAQPVYAYLLKELLGRFPGTAARYWYLSDGGHFENTGAYELLRRRVPFILICDAGCDPEYTFQDLASLVRMARTDFDAEVVFYDGGQLDALMPKTIRPYFGTQDDIRRLRVQAPGTDAAREKPCPHALLAAVFYDDPARVKRIPDSVMVILKPVFSGDEPADVIDYRRTHPRFPQEPTSDQFFDEAQWESYRRLGDHVASRVFGFAGDDDGTGFWRPLDLTRPPAMSFPGTPRGRRR